MPNFEIAAHAQSSNTMSTDISEGLPPNLTCNNPGNTPGPTPPTLEIISHANSASNANIGDPIFLLGPSSSKRAQHEPFSAVSMETQPNPNPLDSDPYSSLTEAMDTLDDTNEDVNPPSGNTIGTIPDFNSSTTRNQAQLASTKQPTIKSLLSNPVPSKTSLVAEHQRAQIAKNTKAILDRSTNNGYFSALAEDWDDDMDTSPDPDQASPKQFPPSPPEDFSPPTPMPPTDILAAFPDGTAPGAIAQPSHSFGNAVRPDLTSPPRTKRFNDRPSPSRGPQPHPPRPSLNHQPTLPSFRSATSGFSSPQLHQHSSDRQLINGHHYILHRHLTEVDRLTVQLRQKVSAPCGPASLLLLYRLYHGGSDLTPTSLPTALAREPQGDVIATLALMGIHFVSESPVIFEANGGFMNPLNFGEWDYTADAISQEALLAACSLLPANTWIEDQPSLPGTLTLVGVTTQQELLAGLKPVSLLVSRDGAVQLIDSHLTSDSLPQRWTSPPESTRLSEAIIKQAISRASRSRSTCPQGTTYVRISGLHRALEDQANEDTAHALLLDALSRWNLLDAIDVDLLRPSLTGKWLLDEKDSETGSILIPLISARDPSLPHLFECRSKPFTLPQWRPPKDQPTKTPRSYSCSLSAQMLTPAEHAIIANRPHTFLIARACASNTKTLERQIQALQEYLEAKHQYVAKHSTIQIGYIRHRTREETNPLRHTTYEKCLYVLTSDRHDQQPVVQVISRGYHLSLAPSVTHATKTDPPAFPSTHQPTISISYPNVTVLDVASVLVRIIPPADIGDVYSNDNGGVSATLLKQVDPAALDCIRALVTTLADPTSTHVTQAPTPKGILFRSTPSGQTTSSPPLRTPTPAAPTRPPQAAGVAQPKPLTHRIHTPMGGAPPRHPPPTPRPPSTGVVPPSQPTYQPPSTAEPHLQGNSHDNTVPRQQQERQSVRTQATTAASPLTDSTLGMNGLPPPPAQPPHEDIARLTTQMEALQNNLLQTTAELATLRAGMEQAVNSTRSDVAILRSSQLELNHMFSRVMSYMLSARYVWGPPRGTTDL